MKHHILTAGVMASALIAAPTALADEVWIIEGADMEMYYEADLPNGMAVLTVDDEGQLFIQDLAGEYEGRTEYDGVWISAYEDETCDFAIANPQTGELSYSWGRVKMVFIDPDFPSRWVAFGSECMDTPDEDPIVAIPKTYED